MLSRHRHESMARTVTYSRGEDSVELRATPGETVFDRAEGYDLVVQYESRDFILRAEDLVLDGQAVTPEQGDIITEARDGQEHRYEVAYPGQGVPWRWFSRQRKEYRIHTKRLEAVA